MPTMVAPPQWQAMALGALPSNLPSTLKHLGTVSDEILFNAGDESTNLSWYAAVKSNIMNA